MEDLKTLQLPRLLDMLAINTNLLTQMMKAGYTDEEYRRCKKEIDLLTTEIRRRKQAATEKT